MTSRIFINNQTTGTYTLTDIDHNRFPIINGGQIYSLRLHYSNRYETQYSLTLSSGQTVYFWLDRNGDVYRTNVSSGIANLYLGNQGNTTSISTPTNYITIVPIGNSQPLPPPSLFAPTIVSILRTDDY